MKIINIPFLCYLYMKPLMCFNDSKGGSLNYVGRVRLTCGRAVPQEGHVCHTKECQ